MRDAKNYKNTIEFAAENIYSKMVERYDNSDLRIEEGEYPPYNNIPDITKKMYRCRVIDVLNAVNYFENKTCADCGYFDPVENVCFGEDREHKEHGNNPICGSFVPTGLVCVEESKENTPYHRIIGPELVIGIYRPSDDDINYAIELLEKYRQRELLKGKLRGNMIIEEGATP